MSERRKTLEELNEWEAELTARHTRGEIDPWEALSELREIKLTRLKILSVPP